jgi:very-short-patch-repair endonuclease
MFPAASLHAAARQFGAISRAQLVEHGMSASSISRARAAGALVEVVPGVFRFASSPDAFALRCMATQIATAPVGYLNGWTAARLAGLRKMPATPIHVTVPTSTNRTLPEWVDCHRSRWYDEQDVAVRDDGLRVATPARMLFALAAAFNQFRFERAAEDAWHLGLITPEMAASYLEAHRCRGKDGVATMERWLDRALCRDRATQSDLERVLLEALDQRALPEPERQYPVTLLTGETVHIDIAWPQLRLAVEPGSAWWHGGDRGQRSDQARDRALAKVGWLTLRFDDEMRNDPAGAAAEVEDVYRRRATDLRNLRTPAS